MTHYSGMNFLEVVCRVHEKLCFSRSTATKAAFGAFELINIRALVPVKAKDTSHSAQLA